MPAMPEPEPATIRERYRAQVRAEVKQAALDQLAQAGPAGVSISAIGLARASRPWKNRLGRRKV